MDFFFWNEHDLPALYGDIWLLRHYGKRKRASLARPHALPLNTVCYGNLLNEEKHAFQAVTENDWDIESDDDGDGDDRFTSYLLSDRVWATIPGPQSLWHIIRSVSVSLCMHLYQVISTQSAETIQHCDGWVEDTRLEPDE